MWVEERWSDGASMLGGFLGVTTAAPGKFGALHQNLGTRFVAAQPGLSRVDHCVLPTSLILHHQDFRGFIIMSCSESMPS